MMALGQHEVDDSSRSAEIVEDRVDEDAATGVGADVSLRVVQSRSQRRAKGLSLSRVEQSQRLVRRRKCLVLLKSGSRLQDGIEDKVGETRVRVVLGDGECDDPVPVAS